MKSRKAGISVTEVVKPPSHNDDAGNAKPTKTQRAYIAETLHIYMTLSNLRGVPYSVPFDSGANLEKKRQRRQGPREKLLSYDLSRRSRALRCDRIGHVETARTAKALFADQDQKRTIDAQVAGHPQFRSHGGELEGLCRLRSRVRGLPVGLAPRLIGATLGTDPKRDEYEGRRLPIDSLHGDLTICPSWLPDVRSEEPFWVYDGGRRDH